MDTKEVLLEKLQDYYNYNLHKNHSIKYHLSSDNYNYLFETISISLGRLESLSFPYTSYLKVLEKTISHILSNKKILNVKTVIPGLQNRRVLIIAPGHSLSKSLAWLKEHASKFLLVCYSQCLDRLLSENIVPDIVTIVDGEKKLYNDFKGIKNSLLKSVNLYKK